LRRGCGATYYVLWGGPATKRFYVIVMRADLP
jgi:hypothetical protein